MKTFELNGLARTDLGQSAAKQLRNSSSVPCVLYGGKENSHFSVTQPDIRKLIYSPNVYIVELVIGGKKSKAIIKDIQTDPLSDKVIHIDFQEVFEDRTVIIDVPLKMSGSSIGVKKGGIVKTFMRTLTIKALPKFLPDELTVDVTDLDIAKSIRIKDLKFDNISILEPANAQVITINATRVSKSEETAAAAAGDKKKK